MARQKVTIDANEAVAYVAYRMNEVIALFPITPSSPMGEHSDEWAAKGVKNLWGTVPSIMEMQSEGGAAGAVHGALSTGAMTTTFTASQGLLLMIPNMYKIAGELTSTVFHVTARALAPHALSIFGDQSDVMATRQTGFALIASNSVQEAHDMALIAQAATLKSRVPFLHFFDGFRTSHEVKKIEQLDLEDMRAMIDDELVRAHRERALRPEKPVVHGTAQNPDVFFQGREACNRYYAATPAIVQEAMDKFAGIVGRSYHLFDYFGPKDADRVVIAMGSGIETLEETAKFLNSKGEKIGVVAVRLYRPFSVADFVKVLPSTVKKITVLDRTKEQGSAGEPLYLDVVTAISEALADGTAPFKTSPMITSGRYGMGSKDFTPAMAAGVFEEMKKDRPMNHFSVGIEDDVTGKSIKYDPSFLLPEEKTVRCMFFGLGSDGTVGANKNSIKIIGIETENDAQGYFEYDSKKSGSTTISHLRFGPNKIRAPYLIGENDANFLACHMFTFLEKLDITRFAAPNAIFLLNTIYGPEEVWDKLPVEVQEDIIAKKMKFYVIDAFSVANKTGMGGRINTIMQTCFFAISGVLPRDEAIDQIKKSIKKTYGKKGEKVVAQNFEAVDSTLANLFEVKYPNQVTSKIHRLPAVPAEAPEFVQKVIAPMIAAKGDKLPVSLLPADGAFPVGTSQWEKRNIAQEVPVWDPETCIQCGKCSIVCPHGVIRQKVYDASYLENAPKTFKSVDSKGYKEFPGTKFTLQISVSDCTGCGLCVETCPAKNKADPTKKAINLAEQLPLRESEGENWKFFMSIPDPDRTKIVPNNVKLSQQLRPLFEFSGACAGCGETPYIKLLTQLFGDHAIIANATGCSSIYSGNLPTTPYTTNADGYGPAWANSLFEDNAEFGLGMRLTIDKQNEFAKELLKDLSAEIGSELVEGLLNADQSTEAGLNEQRKRVAALKSKLAGSKDAKARNLVSLADTLVKKSVWIVGGDGWAYDIGYGGLDHVLASGRNVNILVLDTEVYSNTGGQASKSTPRAAVAKFAAKGKDLPKKDLGYIAMTYGYIYVGKVSMGANDAQVVKTFLEAEAYDGPSLIVAYSHCINHGIDMRTGLQQQKKAVESGHWPLFRYNPAKIALGENPLTIDSKAPSIPLTEYAYGENRYKMLVKSDEARAEVLIKEAQVDAERRWELYRQLAELNYKLGSKDEA
ncbi:pyruvate:ferredoxin (flavodoxin) oxidoreductase [Flexilinea flocculi]|jgi:pyruvate-ferredoxin/flavodoxin oxidoreductase|uniref:Pyruvate:ferredoxin (Flavodoxin) oxidoreductase, homodimeric n=1 Tax=Flexilinea flocculi TaxID=1678840 RepID=A0A0K8PAT1_9CHLR|nr:pyruvate:ferredoxin (flavodoxin) oxidoreductase [Flexilinea flocculi]NMB94764.1 pyruvate:ferredoxin (flavodoxin) oxidoreductase [Flexilinea flocculi]GAP39634.1 pyruvate:ferredoxin (flavodoxin) oxidoreductase, homodimeric [Flexilinea flocculi]